MISIVIGREKRSDKEKAMREFSAFHENQMKAT